ncbi:MAG: AAA family ATPase [Candidatus Micrarchaeota archaeon]|nr:AAA family ATPase [Candidatus Micrarchaeota archaeon]
MPSKLASGVIVASKPKPMETGIDGLDNILVGGIPEKSQILLMGGPGTGKTLMGFEVLYNWARKGRPCAFIALDERPDDILENVRNTFTGMDDIHELIEKRLLVIGGYESALKIATNAEDESSYSMGNLMSEIEGIIKSINAEIVVVDSLSFLKLMLGKSLLYNKSISSLVSNLRRLETTSILTLSIPYYDRKKLKFGQELVLFDGVMVLYKGTGTDDGKLTMEIVKMRGNRSDALFSGYSITSSGIKFK